MDIYFLPLADLSDDTTLMQLVSAATPGSMLLLEDVDVLRAARDRGADEKSGDEKGRTSLSGLLNALDGVSSPHGLITVMTSNHKERLDPALVRPGRVDVTERIGLVTGDQVDRLFRLSFGSGWTAPSPGPGELGIAASDVVGVLKSFSGDPSGAESAVRQLLLDASLAGRSV